MNWSRAKTILIFLFLATALFQLAVLLSSNKKANMISSDVIASAVELLKKNDITVSEGIIPDRNYSLSLISADNAVTDYTEFAASILGKELKCSENNEFSSSTGTIRFYANRFNYTPSNGSIIKADSIEKNCKEFLNSLGFSLSEYIKKQTKADSQTKICFINTADGYPIFNSQTVVSVEAGKIVNAQGTWFNITDKDNPVKLKSITAVLIDLLKENIKKPASITEIRLGYTIPESNVFQKSVILIPAWQITFDDGNKITMDARSTQ